MYLTGFTDFSLRALIYIHLHENQRVTVKDIAAFYDVSHNHMVKVIHNLSKLGYIHTTKGRGGGVRLAKPANTINFGELVRQLEPHFNIISCLNENNKCCQIEAISGLKDVLRRATDSFLNIISEYTLADAVTNQAKELLLKKFE